MRCLRSQKIEAIKCLVLHRIASLLPWFWRPALLKNGCRHIYLENRKTVVMHKAVNILGRALHHYDFFRILSIPLWCVAVHVSAARWCCWTPCPGSTCTSWRGGRRTGISSLTTGPTVGPCPLGQINLFVKPEVYSVENHDFLPFPHWK
jgi:hypothetical protein